MRFTYLAQDKKGMEARGDIEAGNEREAAELVVKKGLIPLKIEFIAGAKRGLGKRFSAPLSFGGRLTTFDEIIITRHLGTILATGVDLLSGLDIIAEDAIKPIVKKIVLDIKGRIATGQTLSQAMNAWQAHFNPVLLNLVKAGELSGGLATVLLTHSQELRKDYTFNRKVKGAMIYPVILICALFGMVLLILTIVVPKLKELFLSTDTKIPLYTKIIFQASDIWTTYYLPLSIGMGAALLALIIMFRIPRLRRKITALLWYLPILKTIQKNYSLLRFSKTLSNLIKAGIPFESALKVTGQAIGGRYQPLLEYFAEKNLPKGITLSDSMRAHPQYFPGILTSVVATGEKSGQMDATLAQMSEFYEEEVIYALEQFLVIIEPVLIIIVGIIVGAMTGSLFSPLYRFIG